MTTITSANLHFTGADNSAFFVDGSRKIWTGHGTPILLGNALYLDGSSYIDTPASTDFNFGSGDFTIDFWLKMVATSTAQDIFGNWSPTIRPNVAGLILDDNTTQFIFIDYLDNAQVITTSAINTDWHHFAFIRNGINIILYIDGVEIDGIEIGNINGLSSNGKFGIGQIGEILSSSLGNFYIDDFRITKGLAIWTDDFIVPARSTAYVLDNPQFTFNVTKNVNESFSVSVPPDFATAPNPVVRISGEITTAVSFPSSVTHPSATTIAVTPISIVATPKLTLISGGGGSSGIYNTDTGDCFGGNGNSPFFSSTDTKCGLGNGDWISTDNYKAWIPFTLPNPTTGTLVYARVNFVASSMGGQDANVGIRIGCENATDPANPNNFNDLNMRVMTSASTIIPSPMGFWTPGTTYTFDITTSVQEILNRSDWGGNYKLAVMVFNYNSGNDKGNWGQHRECYSFDNGSNYPTLELGF